jgi:hypothetical protein
MKFWTNPYVDTVALIVLPLTGVGTGRRTELVPTGHWPPNVFVPLCIASDYTSYLRKTRYAPMKKITL